MSERPCQAHLRMLKGTARHTLMGSMGRREAANWGHGTTGSSKCQDDDRPSCYHHSLASYIPLNLADLTAAYHMRLQHWNLLRPW